MAKNKIYLILFLVNINFSVNAQIPDTCLYVSENYSLGGLDCAWGILEAGFTIDSYQWVNCDDIYAPFIDDTSAFYQSNYAGNVAVIIEALGCVDTSYCHEVCIWGIEEFLPSKKEIVTITDITGRETEDTPNTLLIYVYSDGTTEKMIRIE